MDIEPEVLSFQKPFTIEVVKCELKIENNTTDAWVFKIKTTAPKTYCVRPNAGVVLPGEIKAIQVLLQPMEQDPPDDYKCKDKFLVMSIPVTKSCLDSLKAADADIWAIAEANAVGEVKEKKLRVSFLPVPVAANKTTEEVPEIGSQPAAASAVAPAPTKSSSSTANAIGSTTSNPAPSSKKFEQALKEKEEEIKRLQALAKQYKQAAAKSSSSNPVLSLVFVAIIGAVLAYLSGSFAGGNTFLFIIGTVVAFVIGKFTTGN